MIIKACHVQREHSMKIFQIDQFIFIRKFIRSRETKQMINGQVLCCRHSGKQLKKKIIIWLQK